VLLAQLYNAGVRANVHIVTVTSTDGQLTVRGSPRVARKTGQRKRPTAKRTRRGLPFVNSNIAIAVNSLCTVTVTHINFVNVT